MRLGEGGPDEVYHSNGVCGRGLRIPLGLWGTGAVGSRLLLLPPFFLQLKPGTRDGSAFGVASAASPHLLEHGFTFGFQVVVSWKTKRAGAQAEEDATWADLTTPA